MNAKGDPQHLLNQRGSRLLESTWHYQSALTQTQSTSHAGHLPLVQPTLTEYRPPYHRRAFRAYEHGIGRCSRARPSSSSRVPRLWRPKH